MINRVCFLAIGLLENKRVFCSYTLTDTKMLREYCCAFNKKALEIQPVRPTEVSGKV